MKLFTFQPEDLPRRRYGVRFKFFPGAAVKDNLKTRAMMACELVVWPLPRRLHPGRAHRAFGVGIVAPQDMGAPFSWGPSIRIAALRASKQLDYFPREAAMAALKSLRKLPFVQQQHTFRVTL